MTQTTGLSSGKKSSARIVLVGPYWHDRLHCIKRPRLLMKLFHLNVNVNHDSEVKHLFTLLCDNAVYEKTKFKDYYFMTNTLRQTVVMN